MQFTVNSKKLFTKLQAAAQVINKKNTLPMENPVQIAPFCQV